MLAVAYRMLGQVSDAEDVVQEAWLRWSATRAATSATPPAFLVTMTSRLALDRLRRIAARREAYVGEWLPEPVDAGGDPATGVLMAEVCLTACWWCWRRSRPWSGSCTCCARRSATQHAEIAAMLDRSEEAVRQAASRARSHVRERSSRFRPDHETARLAADRFLDAASGGDLGPFLALLAPDVELVADSGGKVRAPRLPIYGADKVTRFLEAIIQRGAPEAVTTAMDLNGSPAVVVRVAGSAVAAMLLDAGEGRIARVFLVANPDKLARIGDVTSG